MSRLFKGYASAYRANQTQRATVRRAQVRKVVVDFYGAMTPGQTISEVTFECTSPWVTFMDNAEISADGRAVSVDVTFNYAGLGAIKATAVTPDATMNYEFEFAVADCPIYPSSQYANFNGPFSLVAVPAP